MVSTDHVATDLNAPFREVIGVVDADGLFWLKNELEGKAQHHESRYLGLKSEAVIDAGRYWERDLIFRKARYVT